MIKDSERSTLTTDSLSLLVKRMRSLADLASHKEPAISEALIDGVIQIERLRSQLAEAHEAVWAMAEDGWLYCGVEGFSRPQQLVNDYTEKHPKGVRS